MSRNSSLLYYSFFLMVLLGTLHIAAEILYLYWVYWWYDWMMHFLGGLSGGLITYWVLAESEIHLFWKGRASADYIVAVFLCVMIVGIAWEVFEYTNNLTQSHEGYVVDITTDLVLDGVGALLAVSICTRKYLNKYV